MHLGCKPDPALPSELSLGALLQATESGGRQRSDEELVIAVQNGESCALDELLGRHQKMLFCFARRYTANAYEARGLVQETMLLATRLIGRFRRESRFVSWLNSIVINTALSEIRREKRILWIALDEHNEAETRFCIRELPDNHEQQHKFLYNPGRIPTLNLRYSKRLCSIMLLVGTLLFFVPSTFSQNATLTGLSAKPDTAAIVQAIARHNHTQTKALERYLALRHYQVEYRGFFKHITAEMDVELQYDAASGKNFRVISQSGSHMLCEKVLKRALDSERDAFLDRGAHALSTANYRFQLIGSERLNGRPSYVLQVEPVSGSPYLFRGKIWVDAADYAVSKMEVQPAKNPSFWISRTLIHQSSSRIDGFWLPRQVQSETKVRIGGTAVMTIDYGPYKFEQQYSPQSVSDNGAELATGTLRARVQ